jgi:hypothetical protein
MGRGLTAQQQAVIHIADHNGHVAKDAGFLAVQGNFRGLEDLFLKGVHFTIKVAVAADVDEETLVVAHRAHDSRVSLFKAIPESLRLLQNLFFHVQFLRQFVFFSQKVTA